MINLPDISVIKEMIKKSIEKLKNAEMNFTASFYDDAVSRSYYAVFHIISALLLTKRLTFSSHNQLIGAFNKEFVHTNIFPIDFNKKIEKLFRLRQTGDYDSINIIDKDTAEIGINIAKEITSKGKDFLSKIYFVDDSYWNN